jgi:predicted nucleotidyltransferase
LAEINKDILAALAYFDMFSYPLTSSELFLFLQQKCRRQEFDISLKLMISSHVIYNFDNFYTLRNDRALITRRLKGNAKAAELIKIAHKVSAVLIRFPYVRGIAISGSLSKNYADEDSDIDLFIVTAKNRLWIARTLMHAFKKLTFLFNKQHYFCMNYYVDERQLQINEKNIYTAIEVATLIPLQGDAVFEQFYYENNWTQHYLPNNYLRLSIARPVKTGFFKKIAEALFSNKFGDVLDKELMHLTAKRWGKKTIEKRLNMHGHILRMCAGRHCSKPDPVNFQRSVLKRYNDKLDMLLHDQENSIAY